MKSIFDALADEFAPLPLMRVMTFAGPICDVCEEPIRDGQMFRDGRGRQARTAHEDCAFPQIRRDQD